MIDQSGPALDDPTVQEALKRADEAASTAHDFINSVIQGDPPPFLRVSGKAANDAIWEIHRALRPLIADEEPTP